MASVKAIEKRYEREHAELTQEPEYETSISIRFDRQHPMPAGKIVLDHEWNELKKPGCGVEPDDGAILARKIHLVVKGPEIRRLLRTFPGAIISVSHDRKYIDEVCDKVYRLTESGLCLKRQN